MHLFGLLRAFSAGDLFQWSVQNRVSGELVFWRPGHEKRVLLVDGAAISVASSNSAESFGRHLLARGHIDAQDFTAAEVYVRDRRDRLGDALITLGILSREDVKLHLREHIEDAICDLFLWPDGAFFLRDGTKLTAPHAPEPILLTGLALEAYRRLDELERKPREVPHDNVRLDRGANWPGEALEPYSRFVAERCEPGVEASSYYQAVGGSRLRFLTTLEHLVAVDVIQVADLGAPPSCEPISLLKVLLDKAPELNELEEDPQPATPAQLAAPTPALSYSSRL